MPADIDEQPHETSFQSVVRAALPLADVPRTSALPPRQPTDATEPPAVRVSRPGRVEVDAALEERVAKAEARLVAVANETAKNAKVLSGLTDAWGYVPVSPERVEALEATIKQLDTCVVRLEQRPARQRVSIASDLYARLTSRVLWTTFILPNVGNLAAVLSGQITWLQFLVILAGTGAGFGVVEGARDVAASAKGHQPAPAPPQPPAHAE